MTKEYLMSKLEYDPEFGEFFRPFKSGSKLIKPYGEGRRTKVGGKPYALNKLAWLYVTGEYPSANIGHINGNPDDFRIDNLVNLESKGKDVVLTQNRMKSLFTYNEETGILTRNFAIGGMSGDVTDERKDGYIRATVDGRRYLAHRLIWLYVYGIFPEKQIDHINHNRSDNRLSNLRSVSSRENAMNRSRSSNNTSGTIGVYRKKNTDRWIAAIKVDNKFIEIGSYNDIEDAIEARKDAEIKYNFHANHGRK